MTGFVALAAILNSSFSEKAKEGQPMLAGTRSALTQSNSLYGPTGLLTIPTAYTAGVRQAAISASFAENVRIPAVNYGPFEYFEVGGAFVDRDGGRNRAIANAKVTIVPQNFGGEFELGIGIIDAADAINQTTYFVASYDLTPPDWDPTGSVGSPIALKVHGGAGTGMFQERFFGGAELLFPNQFALLGEYDTENFNFGIRYVHDDRFRMQLGFQNKRLMFGMTTLVSF